MRPLELHVGLNRYSTQIQSGKVISGLTRVYCRCFQVLTDYYITEFRECFYLFARSGQITSLDELTVVMRSLGMSPTIQELTGYLKGKGGKMSFADFLEVMHIHSRAENLPHEVVNAFKAADIEKKGTIPAKQLRNLLQNWGEGLSAREIDNIFREANVSNNGLIRYEDFVKIACAPVPDYY
ncbi:calmodulin-like protein 4 [Leptidea sinapis]|uniref:calmodulin-like protein 4 n=1 Tax=Leptidea sinapis TaxID=189913 RepID=UPI0021C48A3F|nr:calmodulin-like protein 4 [Leptidea sinapis]